MIKFVIAIALCVVGSVFIFGTSDFDFINTRGKRGLGTGDGLSQQPIFLYGDTVEKGGDLHDKKKNIIFVTIGAVFMIAGVVMFILALG